MSKTCTMCLHFAMCKYRPRIEDLKELIPIRSEKRETFRLWRDSFAEMCDYSLFKEKSE